MDNGEQKPIRQNTNICGTKIENKKGAGQAPCPSINGNFMTDLVNEPRHLVIYQATVGLARLI